MCVQSFDDSQGFAIHITYRNSLRSSSMWEPRHPLLKGVVDYIGLRGMHARDSKYTLRKHNDFVAFATWVNQGIGQPLSPFSDCDQTYHGCNNNITGV
jgi:hypothetical protein